uniref:Cytochrome c biogenesis protein CcsA n=1 Tax=Streptosarcina moshanensis TaxID=3096259 RepID=A0AAU0UDY3_9VIRI
MLEFDFEAFLRSGSFVVLLLTTLIFWIQASGLEAWSTKWIAQIGMLLSNLLLVGLLATRWVASGHVPMSNLYESLMFLCWSLTGCHILLGFYQPPAWLGAITSSSAMLVNGLATLSLPKDMQMASLLVPALQSNWLMMHVSVMILGYGTLLAGSLFSIALLFLLPKQGLGSTIHREVDLSVSSASQASTSYGPRCADSGITLSGSHVSNLVLQLDALSYKSISIGFPLLTLGILSGAVWANEAWGSYWSWDPKETWALVTWLVFATYLHVRMVRGWQGRKPATVASLGFLVLWICYLGVNWLGKGLHSYGWFSS